VSSIDLKPDSPNNVSISEDKKQIIIQDPVTHNTITISTNETNIVNVSTLGPQGQIGPEGPVGGTDGTRAAHVTNITASGDISSSSDIFAFSGSFNYITASIIDVDGFKLLPSFKV
tara:strand:- start:13 stop:360 length:348 start_codon:yes stop_codon:yes gene_type:complete